MTTQAPWKWHKRKHSNTYFLANENETDDLCMIIDDGSAYGEYGTSIDVDGDDARLIAAAPELLEALQMALEWIDAVPSDTILPAMPGFDRDEVNNIINKALGETK